MPAVTASPAQSASDESGSFAARMGLRSSLKWGGIVGACVVCVLVALIALGILDAGALVAAMQQINLSTLAAILVLSVVNYLLRGLRWHLFTREVSRAVPLGSNLAYYATGFAFVITPAKLGEVVRLWLLKSRHGVAYECSVGLLVLDRVFDLAALVAFAGLGVMAGSQHAGALGLCVAVLGGATLLLCWRRAVVTSALIAHRLTGRRWPGILRFMLGAYRTLRALCRPTVVAGALLLSLLAWGAMITGTWLLLNALGFGADPLFSAFVFSFAVLVGVVPFFPAGVGGAEAAMIGILVLAGMAGEAAVTATVVSRLATLWFALLVGFAVAPFVLGRFSRAGQETAAQERPATRADMTAMVRT
jgi:uncharacterized protein (TIRG00374 family)